MIDKPSPFLTIDECDEPFGSLLGAETQPGTDERTGCRLNQTQETVRWFFGTALGKEVLASLTWRTFADEREASSVEPVGPVLRVTGDEAYQLTFILPLRWPRRGGGGELFLLIRGCRMAPGGDASPGGMPEAWDERKIEWAILGRDPAKPRSCSTAVLHEALSVISRQWQDVPSWRWA